MEVVELRGRSEVTKSVLGFLQVHLRALLVLIQTGEMTQSQAKMFTGRCVLKELSLAGHGSGKYPAVRCICNSLLFPIPPTKSWPFKEMMDELAMLLFLSLSHPLFFFLYLSILFHTIEDWSSVYVRLQGKFCPSFARCFKITLKSDAGFGQSPLALGFCAAVRVRSYNLWFADDMSNALLVAVEVVLQSKVSNVRNDVTGATHHITDRLTRVVKTQFSVFLMFCLCRCVAFWFWSTVTENNIIYCIINDIIQLFSKSLRWIFLKAFLGAVPYVHNIADEARKLICGMFTIPDQVIINNSYSLVHFLDQFYFQN